MTRIVPLFIPVILFLITVGFGFWLRGKGRPYNTALFNIHKLIALAGFVLVVLRLRSGFLAGGLSGWMAVVLVGAGLSALMLFATGAVMSIRKEEPGIALFFHRAGPVIITLCLIGLFALS